MYAVQTSQGKQSNIHVRKGLVYVNFGLCSCLLLCGILSNVQKSGIYSFCCLASICLTSIITSRVYHQKCSISFKLCENYSMIEFFSTWIFLLCKTKSSSFSTNIRQQLQWSVRDIIIAFRRCHRDRIVYGYSVGWVYECLRLHCIFQKKKCYPMVYEVCFLATRQKKWILTVIYHHFPLSKLNSIENLFKGIKD